jgi:phenylpropionate dioxygenase-like ring-hydroxylating dioxygenase large terminal subunit
MAEVNSTHPLDRFYTDEHPELGSGPVPTEPYVSGSYFEQERAEIFRNAWLLACHESEIPKPGDFLVKQAAIFNASILIVRDRDGVVRAFHNVCRHRGNKLVCENGQGHAKALFCRFHGWTFALDGRLRGVPEQDRFRNLDKSQHSLKPFTMQMWKGFVFVHAQEHPKQSLREYLGTLADPLEAFPFEQMRPFAHYSTTLRSNWKVGINAFQEAYHVPTVHAVSARTLFVARLCDFRFHGPHRAMTLPISPDFKPKPVEILSSRFTTGMSQNAVQVSSTGAFPGTNPCNTPNYSFDINIVFPSSFIDVGEGYYFTYEFWPIQVDQVHFIMKLYSLLAQKWSQRIGQELSRIFLREGISEDLSTLETTQEGLQSGALPEMVLSDQEIAIRHQYRVIEDILRDASASRSQ